MVFVSLLDTDSACLRRRFRLRLLVDRIWLVKPRRLMTFPLLLTLNLLAAPLLVFILGILNFLVPFSIAHQALFFGVSSMAMLRPSSFGDTSSFARS